METYPRAAVERAMKILEVILRLYREAVCGFQRASFSRKVARAAPHAAELPMGEVRLADGRTGEEESETTGTSTPAATTAAAGDASASSAGKVENRALRKMRRRMRHPASGSNAVFRP